MYTYVCLSKSLCVSEVNCRVSLKETCQSVCRLLVIAADNNTKQLVRLSLGDDRQRCLVMSIIEMLLVSKPRVAAFSAETFVFGVEFCYFLIYFFSFLLCLSCFDTVGWEAGRAFGL